MLTHKGILSRTGRSAAVIITVLTLVSVAAGIGAYMMYGDQVQTPTPSSTLTPGREEGGVDNVTSPATPTGEINTSAETVTLSGNLSRLVTILVSTSQASNVPISLGVRGVENEYVVPTTTATLSVATVAETFNEKSVPSHSTTNVQVEGVDEADIVKNDGINLYIVGRTHSTETGKGLKVYTKVFIVRAYPPQGMKVLASLDVDGIVRGLFIREGKLAVINTSVIPVKVYYVVSSEGKAILKPVAEKLSGSTTLLIYNVKNFTLQEIGEKVEPALEQKYTVSGWYLTSRMIGGRIYLLTTYWVNVMYLEGSSEGARSATLTYPSVNGLPVPEKDLIIPSDPKLIPWLRNYVVVLSADIDSGNYTVKAYLLPHPDRVYMSRDSIYLLSSRWGYYDITFDLLRKAVAPSLPKPVRDKVSEILDNETVPIYVRLNKASEVISEYVKNADVNESVKIMGRVYSYMEKNLTGVPLQTTDVFRLGLNVTTALIAHGTVKGRLLDQFAVTEREDYLIIATTSTAIKGLRIAGMGWLPTIMPEYTTVNGVYVLRKDNLAKAAELTGLATGERIYAAREVGGYLFLVTFRRVDPLYAINVTDPSKPKVIGFIKMPGYSEYLHPLTNSYLLGIGYQADNGGRIIGVKIDLYNVSNPENMSITSEVNITVGHASTKVAWDYKAFMINAKEGYFTLPITIYNNSLKDYIYIIRFYQNGTLRVAGKIPHERVIRAAYIGNYLYTVSSDEVKSVNLTNMKIISSITLK